MFGITSFERNDLWNSLREFENDFSKVSGMSLIAELI